MKTVVTILALILGLSCNAQRITYKDLIAVDWNDHPFSIAELLIEKGYEFTNQQIIESDLLKLDEQSRESFYQMIYTNITEVNVTAAYVCVDEMDKGNLSEHFPAVKLRFMYQSKDSYVKLSDEIKAACGSPDMGFYVSPNSLTFILDKELIDGVPSYYILVYVMSQETFEEIKKAVNKVIEELLKDQ